MNTKLSDELQEKIPGLVTQTFDFLDELTMELGDNNVQVDLALNILCGCLCKAMYSFRDRYRDEFVEMIHRNLKGNLKYQREIDAEQ